MRAGESALIKPLRSGAFRQGDGSMVPRQVLPVAFVSFTGDGARK
jgi:hypothetical protein